MRPHREALSKQIVPMNPSDNVHKTILKPGDTKKPMANANVGRHQKKNIVVPLHNTSRCCGLQVLGSLIFPRVKVTYASSSLDASSAHAHLDSIAILQAEMTRIFMWPNDKMGIELSDPHLTCYRATIATEKRRTLNIQLPKPKWLAQTLRALRIGR